MNIQIEPIFVQNAPVWERFCDIRMAGASNYLFEMQAEDKIRALIIDDYRHQYMSYPHNFAFGAYDNQHMVGFLCGYVYPSQRCAELYNLYILPRYQKKHIGSRMVRMAEQFAGISVNDMILTPLSSAEKFYLRIEYNRITSKHTEYKQFEKHIQPPKCTTVPIFWADTNLAYSLSMVSDYKYSPNQIQDYINTHSHKTVAYFDATQTPIGFAIQDYNNNPPQMFVMPHRPIDFVTSQLVRAL